jgi:hypothetical protein
VSEEVESSKRHTVRENTVVGSDAHCPSVLLALEDEWGEQLLDLDDILVILLLHRHGEEECVVTVITGGVREAGVECMC